MSMPGGFLGGAKDRLLPASIPFRFFLSAALFHVLAWIALLFAAPDVAGFRGGTGMTLAAIHLATLGVMAMTAIGASYQLLPVVTRRPLARDWPPRLSFWLFLPGVALLTGAMAAADSTGMMIGAILACLGLAVFSLVTADNLRRAGSIPVVSAHGWLALASLVLVALLGVLLIRDFETGFLEDHAMLATIHMTLASFGFMGFLVLGLSLVLIPMFILSRSLPQSPGWAQMILSGLALAGFSGGLFFGVSLLVWISLAASLAAAGCYLWLMRTALKTSMRKRLGLSFVLIRTSWAFLVLSLLLAGAVYAGADIPNAPALTGFTILAGWLLTFLTGVLQRIMPFLASMHAAGKSGLPPLLSELTADTPLRVHAACHLAALAVCPAGILLNQVWLVQLGAVAGTAGAVSFALFAVNVALKLKRP
ncbi:hypothetical protein AVO45_00125 [Ruegeria marisrubri]|uniref:Uncharacterized protein n=1 Tax=Ruegeria marisrubri TaxID=1685379 RepID=A0A0X3UEW7_9RHOB|nr:hypothetical protein [Ruegeria marisrubri]KUJ85446.1 hypothetical protein AVO45_00125 [Ruegeria marisrubri]